MENTSFRPEAGFGKKHYLHSNHGRFEAGDKLGSFGMHNMVIRPLFEQAKLSVNSLSFSYFSHIYKELNTEAD